MSKLLAAALSGLIVALALAGCAHRRDCVVNGGTAAPAASPAGEIRAGRGSLGPDLSALPASYEAVDRLLSPLPTPAQYRALRAEEVQCLAAANAPIANLYASESEAVLTAHAHHHSKAAAPTLSKLTAYRAIDERNKAAGTALQLFYSLAEAEVNHDILQRSLGELDRAAANLEQLRHSGLKIPLDPAALERQKLDWLDQQVQLQAAIRQMQGQLQQLCGFENDAATPIWPAADLAVTVTPVDAEAAVVEGLPHRADLGALKMLSGSLNADTLPAARSGMQGISPGLGASIAGKRLLGGQSGSDEELDSRQSQLTQAQADAERTAAREIREAAWNVETRLREIAVASQRQEVCRQHVASLDERRGAGGVTAFDLSTARIELLRAESDTLHRVAAWKIAQAKLKQAQGILAAECGYCLPTCCQ
jgi:outer membrane protein TolC